MKDEPIKRILLVAYNYPPIGTVGSLRTVKFVKYLPLHGWIPTVLTVGKDRSHWISSDETQDPGGGVNVIRAFFPDASAFFRQVMIRLRIIPDRLNKASCANDQEVTRDSKLIELFKSFSYWLRGWLAFPDIYVLWAPFAIIKGLRELNTKAYHAIYSTSPPATDHIVASVLHKLSGIPWVADFRDPWTQNLFFTQQISKRRLVFERRFERSVLSSSVSIITVSGPLADMLRAMHGDRPYGVRSISSGFDRQDYVDSACVDTDKFYITYTGSLYDLKRDPSILFEAISELVDEGVSGVDDIVVRFYGPREQRLIDLSSSFRSKVNIEINGIIPRQESIVKQQESALILVLQWEDPYTKNIYGGKIFEHLGSQRPVIALTHEDGILADLIKDTNVGVVCSSKDQVKIALRGWLDEFRLNGYVRYQGDSREVRKYEWSNLVGELVELLNRITSFSP